jgi:hypothetical protein
VNIYYCGVIFLTYRVFHETCGKIQDVNICVIMRKKCCITACPFINTFIATSYFMLQDSVWYCAILYDTVWYQFLCTTFTLPPTSQSTLSYPCCSSAVFVNKTPPSESAVCLAHGLVSCHYFIEVAIFLTMV